jgi:hypothetical protein
MPRGTSINHFPKNAGEERIELKNADAEQALLGSVIIDPQIYPTIDISLSDFSIDQIRWTWCAIGELIEENVSIDPITIADRLEKDGKLAEVGGPAYLARLINIPSSYLNATDYAKIVKKLAKKRREEILANRLLRYSHSADENPVELDRIKSDFESLQKDSGRGLADPWGEPYTLVDAYQERPPVEHIAGNMFELPSLNIVYGSPGTLKSFLMADLAVCAAAGIDWLAPAPWQIGNIAQPIKTRQCSVMWVDFDNGSRRTHDRIAALSRARNLPIDTPITYYSMPYPWLNATDKGSIGALSLRIQVLGCEFVVIDNLGTVSGGVDENSSEMIQVMSSFRQLAEETGAAIILIHHQTKNRISTGRAGDSLRGHSSIEGSLDMTLMVEREELSDTISIKGPKARGVDINPFSAVFSYEDDQFGELITAKFWGTASEDMHSGQAIRREIKASLVGKVLNKADLSNTVKETLKAVGINRIRDQIDRMAAAGDLLVADGLKPKERIFRLP